MMVLQASAMRCAFSTQGGLDAAQGRRLAPLFLCVPCLGVTCSKDIFVSLTLSHPE